ncbi:MAG: phosphotransferase [Kiritimatiellae bacterium]|nr:phosphotransferase [Kiritimatiellia bacterium]
MSARPRRISSRSHPPRRALVLAAGFGSRLDPLTQLLPKPCVPLWGESLITRVLRQLHAWGVRHVVVNLHHQAQAMMRAASAARPSGMELAFSLEPIILGTGGALRAARWHFSGGEPFWIVNADVAMELDPRPLIQGLDGDPHALSNVWMIPDAGPRTVGWADGRIVTFRHPHPESPGTATFSGVQLVRPEIFTYLPNTDFSSLVQVYESAMREGWSIRGSAPPGARWADVGTLEGLLAAHDAWLPGAASESGKQPWDWAAEGNAHRERGSRAVRCVAMSGSKLTRTARATHALLAPGAVLRREGTGIIVPAEAALTRDERRALGRISARHGGGPWMAHALPARGSGRRFFRIEGRTRSFVLIRDSGERMENRHYAGHARFLRRLGLPVPEVCAESPHGAPRFELWSDAGARSLGDVVREEGWAGATRWYDCVVDTMAEWHTRGGEAARRSKLDLEPAFGPTVYGYEHELFLEEFARNRCECDEDMMGRLRRELDLVAERLRGAPLVLLHRDLQSSNILCPRRGGAVWIDFQGMRFGPAAYDLASLLFDPYVEMSAELRRRWTRRYAERAGERRACADVLPWAAVQRLTQALGAFARLSRGAARAQFEHHIPAGVRMLTQAMTELNVPLPALGELMEAQRSATAAP